MDEHQSKKNHVTFWITTFQVLQNTNLVSYLWHLSFFLLWIVGILCAHNWLSKERITINWPSHTMRTKVTLLWNLQIMSTCTTSTQYCLLHQGSLCKSINPPLALKHEKKPNCYGIVILTCVSWNINWIESIITPNRKSVDHDKV